MAHSYLLAGAIAGCTSASLAPAGHASRTTGTRWPGRPRRFARRTGGSAAGLPPTRVAAAKDAAVPATECGSRCGKERPTKERPRRASPFSQRELIAAAGHETPLMPLTLLCPQNRGEEIKAAAWIFIFFCTAPRQSVVWQTRRENRLHDPEGHPPAWTSWSSDEPQPKPRQSPQKSFGRPLRTRREPIGNEERPRSEYRHVGDR